MWNIIIGLIFVIGGLSGYLTLRFTGSNTAIVVVGLALIAWGVYQMMRK